MQPRSAAALKGGEATLFVRAFGAGKLTFQWLHDGVPLPKADEPVLRLDSLSDGQAGDYRLVVSSPYGNATSDVARVTIAEGEAAFTPAVFSCNAVGYINSTLAPGFSLFVNQFVGPSAVSNVLGPLPGGIAVYQVTENGFKANAMSVNWTRPDAPMPFGEVFYILNPFGVPLTVTTVGEVAQGDLQQALPAGYSIAGSLVPQNGPVSSLLEMPAADADEVWRWNSQSQTYLQYFFEGGVWQPEEPPISIMEAFVVRKKTAVTWRRFFTIAEFGGCPPPFSGPLARVPLPDTSGQLHLFTDFVSNPVQGVNRDYFGQLYAGVSTDENALSPCGVPVRFSDGARAGHLDGGIVTAPGLPAGRFVLAQLRIWSALDAGTYEEARAAGCFTAKSELVPTLTGAPLIDGRPGIPPWPVGFNSLRPQIPRVVIEPASGSVPAGQTVRFSATDTGPASTGFQWRHNGVEIPGANGPQLELSNVRQTDSGEYNVLVANGRCVLSSGNSQLTVFEPVKIVLASPDCWFAPNERAKLSVTATGGAPLRYQWFVGPNPLVGETNSLLELWPWQINSQAPYSATVSNPFGSVNSGPMMVRPRPSLKIEPASVGTYRLVWPRQASQFVLEQSTDLTHAGSWELVTQPVALGETECVVTVPRKSERNQWFRLRIQ